MEDSHSAAAFHRPRPRRWRRQQQIQQLRHSSALVFHRPRQWRRQQQTQQRWHSSALVFSRQQQTQQRWHSSALVSVGLVLDRDASNNKYSSDNSLGALRVVVFRRAPSSSSGFSFPSAGASTTTTTSSSTSFAFGGSGPSRTFAPSVVSLGTTSSVPAFGSGVAFGAPTTSAPSFSSFGASPAPSFAFGAPAATAQVNPLQTSATSTGSTGGFPFGGASSSVAPPGPVFGAVPSTFSFGGPGASSSFSFGGGGTAPTSSALFQFSGGSSTGSVPAQPSQISSSLGATGSLHRIRSKKSFQSLTNSTVLSFSPFSISEDAARRPIAKAKRRAPKS